MAKNRCAILYPDSPKVGPDHCPHTTDGVTKCCHCGAILVHTPNGWYSAIAVHAAEKR